MRERIVLVRHMPRRPQDRLSRMLLERGYQVDWCAPVDGEPLPEPDGPFAAAVVYGGMQSANDGPERPYLGAEIEWLRRWVGAGRPVLGICLGGQLLARALGARVAAHPQGLREVGYRRIEPTESGRGFLPGPLHVYHWHGEGFELPAGAELLARGETFPNQAFRFGEHTYGVQFHPEVTVEIMKCWMDETPAMLQMPGAHPAERQLQEAERYDAPMGAWLARFLTTWPGHRT